ncbi:hypothetical protein PG996_004936 [Apiospora saccharicola]|uniref:Peptidase metallopeptidase domain-containing protein n=1 Tax=Apiospora saccharicola TaxID=335842 RepID=A0ABR1VK55_9PEZI
MLKEAYDDWKVAPFTISFLYLSGLIFSVGVFYTFVDVLEDTLLKAKACLWMFAFLSLGFITGFCFVSERARTLGLDMGSGLHQEPLVPDLRNYEAPPKYKSDRMEIWLTVRFLNGSDEERELVRAVVEKHYHDIDLPIRLTFAKPGDHEFPAIRVLFTTSGVSKSQVGFWPRSYDPDEPTMSLNIASLSPEWKQGTILHQFGHALGFRHLYGHPESEAQRKEAGRLVRGRDWLCFNCIRRNYTPLSINGRKLFEDPKSIMYYPVDPGETDSTAAEISINTALSEGDKMRLLSLYPAYMPFDLCPGIVIAPQIPTPSYFESLRVIERRVALERNQKDQ